MWEWESINNLKQRQLIGFAITVIKSAMMKMDGEVLKAQGTELEKF